MDNDVHVNCVHDYRVRGIYTVLNVPSMRSILCLRLMHCQNSTTCSCIVHNNNIILPSCTHAYMHTVIKIIIVVTGHTVIMYTII